MKRLTIIVSLIAVIAVLFTACGAADGAISDHGYVQNTFTEQFDDMHEEYATDAEAPASSAVTGTANNTSSTAPDSARKIIENLELSVQTKEFDTLMENIYTQVETLGGYIENSSISGRSMDSSNTRYAQMTLRIPAENSDTFTAFMSENSVITRQEVRTEDVTLQYVDMQSRVSALETEKATLERLLAEATSIDDILSITEKLTNVIADIESYRSQLRVYDNLVDYTTVTVYIDEVEFTVVGGELNTWQKIGANLRANFAGMWRGVKAIFVFLISAIPYLIPFAVIGVIVLLIVRHNIKKRRKKSVEAAKESAAIEQDNE